MTRPPAALLPIVILAITVAPATAPAQLPVLEPGLRVRVEAPSVSARALAGILMHQRPDTLSVALGSAQIRYVPTAAISTLHVSAGSSRKRFAVVGALLGGGALIASAVLFGEGWDLSDAGELAGGFGLTGALVGGTVGWLSGREIWTPIYRRHDAVAHDPPLR